MSENKSKYIRWFEETTIDDVLLMGGKNTFLGVDRDFELLAAGFDK